MNHLYHFPKERLRISAWQVRPFPTNSGLLHLGKKLKLDFQVQFFGSGVQRTKGLFLDFSNGNQWSANKIQIHLYFIATTPRYFVRIRLMNNWNSVVTDSIPSSPEGMHQGCFFIGRDIRWVLSSWSEPLLGPTSPMAAGTPISH